MLLFVTNPIDGIINMEKFQVEIQKYNSKFSF